MKWPEIMGSLAMAICQFVRQTFIEWATKTVNSSYWARLYYQGQREKGKSH